MIIAFYKQTFDSYLYCNNTQDVTPECCWIFLYECTQKKVGCNILLYIFIKNSRWEKKLPSAEEAVGNILLPYSQRVSILSHLIIS